jgi:hypothetical protein
LATVCWVHIRGCPACADVQSGDWDIAKGLSSLFAERGVDARVTERFRRSPVETEAVSFEALRAAIGEGQTLVATFCAERSAAIPAVARRRSGTCFSVGVIGAVTVGGAHYLVARDGLTGSTLADAAPFRQECRGIGLAEGGVWGEPGTGLYSWQTGNENVVVVSVGGESAH